MTPSEYHCVVQLSQSAPMYKYIGSSRNVLRSVMVSVSHPASSVNVTLPSMMVISMLMSVYTPHEDEVLVVGE